MLNNIFPFISPSLEFRKTMKFTLGFVPSIRFLTRNGVIPRRVSTKVSPGSRDLLRPPFAKTAKYQGSFRINGARTYNTIPRTIRQVVAFSKFKTELKCHLKQ